MYDIFNAFKYTSFDNVKAVIIGQDPYHGIGQAHGLCFPLKRSYASSVACEYLQGNKNDLGIDNTGKHGELTKWAKTAFCCLIMF